VQLTSEFTPFDPGPPLVKVLYMCGYAEDAIVHASGAFLAKPFGRADLVREMRELLDA
jgi:hypothetical protein